MSSSGNITHNAIKAAQARLESGYSDNYDYTELPEGQEAVTCNNVPKCECGVSAVNGDKHSDYCPLYKEEK